MMLSNDEPFIPPSDHQHYTPHQHIERLELRLTEEYIDLLQHGNFTFGNQRITLEPGSTPQSTIRYRLWTNWKNQVQGPGTRYFATLVQMRSIAIKFWSYEPHNLLEVKEEHAL